MKTIAILILGLLLSPFLSDICGWPIVLVLLFFSLTININKEY
jgi:hypothetical protein